MHCILIKSLEDYPINKSIIETTLARVESYRNSIEDPTSYSNIHMGSQSEVGMIKGKGGKPLSPVEGEVLKKENDEMFVVENLKEWIKEDLSRIYPLQIEVEQIEGALNALTKQQKHIIECRYFERIFWDDTEISFNNKFKTTLTCGQLQKKNKGSLDKLYKILKIYYDRKYL